MSEHDDDNPGRRPPRGRPFQPGQSGNRTGKPKGSLNFSTALRKVMREPTVIIVDGKQITVPRMEALCQKLSIMAVSGDLGAMRYLLDHMAKLEEPAPGPAGGAVDLAAAAAIIAAHDQDVLAVHGVKPEAPDAG